MRIYPAVFSAKTGNNLMCFLQRNRYQKLINRKVGRTIRRYFVLNK